MSETHVRKLEDTMHSAPLVQLAGARVVVREAEAEAEAEAGSTLPARRELFHAAHALHGSMYFLAPDNAAFFAVNALDEEVFVLDDELHRAPEIGCFRRRTRTRLTRTRS